MNGSAGLARRGTRLRLLCTVLSRSCDGINDAGNVTPHASGNVLHIEASIGYKLMAEDSEDSLSVLVATSRISFRRIDSCGYSSESLSA